MSPENSAKLCSLAIALLAQCTDLLNDILLEDDQLSFESKAIPGSTVGKHLRHLADHFRLFLDAAELSGPLAFLDYDVRIRNTDMEKSRTTCGPILEGLSARFGQMSLATDAMDTPVTLAAQLSPSGGGQATFASTLGRELWFCCHHGIHHMASIRYIAVGELGLSLPDTFGFAPSTLEALVVGRTEKA